MFLTTESRLSIGTARQNVDVVGFGLATSPLAIVGLEWMSVGVVSAAGFLAESASRLGGARALNVEALAVLGAHVELESAEECLEDVGHEFAFDYAGVDRTGVARVLRLAEVDEYVHFALVGGEVVDLPWNALGLARLLRIDHRTVVALVESLAKGVHLVYGLAFTFAMVFFKVTPAAVLVDVLKGRTHHITQSSISSCLVQECLELLFHVDITTINKAGNATEGCELYFHFRKLTAETFSTKA